MAISHVFTGFDSAWVDDPRRPGAIASLVLEDGRLRLVPPAPASFDHARAVIAAVDAPFHLIALDQSTIVPNETGMRPVERVAASLITRLGSGVQPSNRGRTGMFDDDAPIWRFLAALPHRQEPLAAIGADVGRLLMEVYPALSLPGLFPAFATRLPRYNPERRKTFRLENWQAVTTALADWGTTQAVEGMDTWAGALHALPRPRKPDQDAIDAVLCAIVAWHWWAHGTRAGVLIGDTTGGYIVAAASPATRLVLETAAERLNVAVS